jgi:hypothetical protein
MSTTKATRKKKPLPRLTIMLFEAAAMYQRAVDKRTDFQLKYVKTYEGDCVVLNHALSRAPRAWNSQPRAGLN